MPAAVLVPLYWPAKLDHGAPLENLHVVLTRRRLQLRRHAGEISFPGGRYEPIDGSLSDTALRETQEEIGLTPSDVKLLGELPVTNTFVTNYAIHPFVALIAADNRWKISPLEVDAVLELSLQKVKASRTQTRLERYGFSFETSAYVVDEHVIWGATARILQELLQRISTTQR